MKGSIRKRILVLLASIILLPVALYWLTDTWLESSGGRKLLEQMLTERIGMSVSLEGEFELMLFPAIGVTGTELVIGGPEPESEFARSREYEISIALLPLFDRKVLLEWVRITGGLIYPERYSPGRESGAGENSATKSLIPEIKELSIREFQIVLPGEDQQPLQIEELTLSEFEENKETPFALEILDLVTVEGKIRWDSSLSQVQLGDLQLELGGQRVSGHGCLLLESPGSLNFEMQADVFDLDAFEEHLPDFGGGDGSSELPFEIRARFKVDELSSRGAVARGVVLSLGDQPACG